MLLNKFDLVYFMFTADMTFALTFDVFDTVCRINCKSTEAMSFQQRAYPIANTTCDIKATHKTKQLIYDQKSNFMIFCLTQTTSTFKG